MTKIQEIKKELRRKLKYYAYRGKVNIAIHKNTVKDVLKILDKVERKQ